MAVTKPNYHSKAGGFVDPVEFRKKDLSDLSKICGDPLFIDGVRSIAARYCAYGATPTKGEELATLRDLANSAYDLAVKLENMPKTVRAQFPNLHDIDVLKNALKKLEHDAGLIVSRTSIPKGGRPKETRKRAAALHLSKLFAEFNLPWIANTWEERPCPAIDALYWIFAADGDNANRESAAEYIDEIIKDQAKGKPV